MKIINLKKFTQALLDENVEVFVVYITFFSHNLSPIHLVIEAQITLLIIEEVKILTKYSDFSNIFLEKKTWVLSKITN